MCIWMLAILTVPRKVAPAVTSWTSDLSGLPVSKRRAYGRIINSPFLCQDATLKRLKSIQSSDLDSEEVQVYALTLSSDGGNSVIIYFTKRANQSIERFEYRRRPTEAQSIGSIPIGITSTQFTALDSKSGQTGSHLYRQSFSARLILGSVSDNRITGSIIVVFPDSRRSFVTGSFKARLTNFALP
jgi:hypothetical protein